MINSEKKSHYGIILLGFVFILASFQLIFDFHKPVLKIWDEASSATNAVQMLINKSYLSVTVSEMPDKEYDTLPPMNIWTKVIAYKLFGVNEFSVRLQSVIAALLTFLLFMYFSKKHLNEHYFAIFALLIAATTIGFNGYHVARNGDPETLLILFTSLYFFSTFLLLEEYPKGRNKYLFLTGLGIFMALFTKSVAGLVPLAGIIVYALFTRNTYQLLRDYRFHLTWIAVIALLAVYYLTRNYFEPGYLDRSIFREMSLYHTFPYDPKHPEATFYLKYLSSEAFFPFFYLIPLTIPAFFMAQNQIQKKLILYSFSSGFFFIAIHSTSITKNEWYIAPVYPFIWSLLAVSLTSIVQYLLQPTATLNRFLRGSLLIVLIVGLGYVVYLNYPVIYKTNQGYKTWTYDPEREGDLLRSIKGKTDKHSNIVIVSDQHPRQMLFYIKKYELERGDTTLITKTISDELIGKKILVCRSSLKKAIDTLYQYQKLDGDKYGSLLLIDSKKIPTQSLD